MSEKSHKRPPKKAIPVLAICYDFDKTLSPNDMQAQGFIQAVGYKDPEAFWKETNSRAKRNDMDQNLSWMYQMMLLADGRFPFNKETLAKYGSKVKLFRGVKTWFERINSFGKEHKVNVEHYVISSGLKEMIEGTEIAKRGVFKKIYASSFFYNKQGAAKWPAQVINYTNKTQFLFRIEKGVLDINDFGVNDYFPPESVRVPFRNIVYIGDSDTDVPCMKLVNSFGGHSIGVFDPETGNKEKVYKMMDNHRIKYFVPADYSKGSDLEVLVKNIILKTAENEKLEALSVNNQNEAQQQLTQKKEQEIRKALLIFSLISSKSFAMTLLLIRKLNTFDEWTDKQREMICKSILNPQVRYAMFYVLVQRFFSTIVSDPNLNSPHVKHVRAVLASLNHTKSIQRD